MEWIQFLNSRNLNKLIHLRKTIRVIVLPHPHKAVRMLALKIIYKEHPVHSLHFTDKRTELWGV